MKKFILFILVASMLCGTAAAREWYEGGTLHWATVEQYLTGESADVLATTADWVCSTVSDSEIQKLTMDDVKAASGAVAMCIITATEGNDEHVWAKSWRHGHTVHDTAQRKLPMDAYNVLSKFHLPHP